MIMERLSVSKEAQVTGKQRRKSPRKEEGLAKEREFPLSLGTRTLQKVNPCPREAIKKKNNNDPTLTQHKSIDQKRR